jgi:histone demethylase JARID1
VPELDWDSFEIVAAVGKDYDFKDGKEYNLKDFQAVCDDFKTNHFKKTHPEGSSTVTEDECERKFWKLVSDPNETCQVEYGVDLHGR